HNYSGPEAEFKTPIRFGPESAGPPCFDFRVNAHHGRNHFLHDSAIGREFLGSRSRYLWLGMDRVRGGVENEAAGRPDGERGEYGGWSGTSDHGGRPPMFWRMGLNYGYSTRGRQPYHTVYE